MEESNAFELAKSYFTQQAELYGKDFHVDLSDSSKDSDSHEVARDLQDFYNKIKDCQKCRLADGRTQVVFGSGNANADIMCIGEGPGFEEDRKGEPFVGAAGQLLNKILAAIDFSREEVYIANIVKCRPPGNRDPQPDEIEDCIPYLKQQIQMVKPNLILALGRISAQALLGSSLALSKLRGTVHQMDEISVVVTYHPAALLRNEGLKRGTWEDVKLLRRLYDKQVAN